MARTHFRNQRVEFVERRQGDLFPANGGAVQSRCGIIVNHTSFDCDVQNASEESDCVVVVSRRRKFGVGVCPFSAICGRDLADLCFIQSRPAFDERGKALSPIVARARSDPQAVVEVA